MLSEESSPLARLQRAIDRRAAIRSPETDALRIVDGKSDRFADLEIDDFGGRWLVQTRCGDFPEWLRDAVQEPLTASSPAPRSIYWKPLGEKNAPTFICGEPLAEAFAISENGARYWIDFASGYSQGIFLDQRANRQLLRESAHGITVLNTFAYTCAFGVAAALGGAQTTNLDLSKSYLAWGKRNYALNQIDPDAHDFIYGDTFDWLRRFAKKQRRFDTIILDPPTFSRSDKGQIFTIETGYGELVALASELLAPHGTLLCMTNQRSLSAADFRKLVVSGLAEPRHWRIRAEPMPPDFPAEPYLKTLWINR